MPELRKKEKFLIGEIESIDEHLANEETYVKLAENLESFLARLRDAAGNSSLHDRQQVLPPVVPSKTRTEDRVPHRHPQRHRENPASPQTLGPAGAATARLRAGHATLRFRCPNPCLGK